jgi:hypothetical protein
MPSGGVEKKGLQQRGYRCDAIVMQAKPGVFEIGGVTQRLALNTVLADPDEVKVVSENDVLRERLVACDLIGLQHLVEMLSDRLVLDIAENEAAARDLEIWRALVGHALGFVLNGGPVTALIGKGLQERLQCGTICVFGFFVDLGSAQRKEIAFEDVLFGHRAFPTRGPTSAGPCCNRYSKALVSTTTSSV